MTLSRAENEQGKWSVVEGAAVSGESETYYVSSLEKDTKKQTDAWEEEVKDWEWAALLRGLSLGFVRARARSVTWE